MTTRQPILTIENLSISFGGLKAVDNLSFSIHEGEVFGLIGPNGAGKTTVFNCITQFYKPDQGNIYFRSAGDQQVNLVTYPTHKIIELGLARTFQNVELIYELSVIDNLLVGAHVLFHTGFIRHIFKTKKVREEEKKLREKAEGILDLLNLLPYKDFPVGSLPYGMLKKVELGRVLMSDPKLIILDEPAAGLNDVETEQLADVIQQIREQFKCSILLVEHDMRFVMRLCDRICAISFGKLLAIGTPEEIQRNKDVQVAYLGEGGDE